MKFVDDDSYDVLFEDDVEVFKPDGSRLLTFRKNVLSREAVRSAWSVLQKYQQKSRNRGVAAGRENEYSAGEGRSGKTLESPKGWDVNSGIVGSFERTARIPYCRSCAWNADYPDKFKKLIPLAMEVTDQFCMNVPDRYMIQRGFAERTHPDWIIPGTVFTTLTINKNFRTACHKDAGDLEAGFSTITVIRQGVFKGGNLVLPNWRVAVKLDTHDLLMFDAHEFHGNTQIVPLTEGAQRCSIVLYYREKILNCLSKREELSRVKSRKTGDPLWG